MTEYGVPRARLRRTGALLFGLGAVLSFAVNAHADSTQVLIAHGLVTKDQGDGADLFFRGTFAGNGRTCGTCHRVDNNLGIDADFIATLPSNDPIFVAEFPPPAGVPGLERPLLMRGFGLILENVDGLENPTVKFVMRGVPHTLSLVTSVKAPADGRAPVERTGWSGDGAPDSGTLNLFAKGAVIQHFTKTLGRVPGTDFRLPTQSELNKIEQYLRATGRLNELNLANARLADAGAELGRRIFNNLSDPSIGAGKCFLCHANMGANVSNGTNVNFNTGIERVVHRARSVENFPFDGGFGTTSRPCDGDPSAVCFGDGTFNTPPVIEAADTPPFFHNNVIDTIEQSVEFYSSQAFRDSPSGGLNINLTLQESANVGAALRVINASFNVDMSIQRNNAAITLENSSFDSVCGGGGGPVFESTSLASTSSATDTSGFCTESASGAESGKRATVDAELALSNEEAQDAVDVLSARNLHADAVTLLKSAISKNNQAIQENASQTRKKLMQSAVNDLTAAKAKFGTGLTFTLGAGNLLF